MVTNFREDFVYSDMERAFLGQAIVALEFDTGG
jgi:hypothetical protein